MEEYKKSDFVPEFLSYFLYEKYDEEKIINVLEKELSWVKPDDPRILTHSDCLVHDAAMYLYNQVFGYSLLSLELSVMIREGAITRENAEKRLNSERCLFQVPIESIEIMCQRCGIEKDNINKIVSRAKRLHKMMKLFLKLKNIFSQSQGLNF